MTFGENLKRICNERGTNPTTVCKELGLSTSKVNLWNKGTIPKRETLLDLSNYLHCSVMEFFADESDLVTEQVLDEDEKDMIAIFRCLTREQKHKIMATLYSYREETQGA